MRLKRTGGVSDIDLGTYSYAQKFNASSKIMEMANEVYRYYQAHLDRRMPQTRVW